MSRELQKRLFTLQVLVAFLVCGSMWGIYLKCFSCKIQEKLEETKLKDDSFEYIESHPANIRHINAEVKAKVNDMENLVEYPLERKYNPKLLTKKLETKIPTTYDPYQIHMEKLKTMLRGDDLSRDVDFEDDFLRAYITSNDFKVENAFSKIINYLNLRIDHDELFHNVSFDFTTNPAYRFVTLLPHRQKDGSATILFEIGKWDPDAAPLVHLKRMLFMIYMQELRNPLTQANGFSAIYDFKDVGLRYAPFATRENLHLLSHVAHEVMPVKFVGIHIINLNVIANVLITLIRPFLPAFIEKIFYVHSSVDGLLKFFPISSLPVQYGGHLTDFYAADWIRKANEQHDNYPPGEFNF